MTSRFKANLVLLILLASLSGCTTLSYYSQSVLGHTKLMLARQPVGGVIKSAPDELRSRLQLSIDVRTFAVKELGLPDNRSYTHYVALERDFPVWVVVAAPEFSVTAKQWCYLVIGCAAYRGYFREDSAHRYADRLQAAGYDTQVGGATAYSTLGWFADPILSSMLRYNDTQFVDLLLHELAHQRLYVNGDTEFNEAFASVVAEVGTSRWLRQNRPEALEGYRIRVQAQQQFAALVAATRERLQALYKTAIPDAQMRKSKQTEFMRMKSDYQQLKKRAWQGVGWFDGWFEAPINNARVVAFSTYSARVPALKQLLSLCGEDLTRFYRVLASASNVDGRVVLPGTCS